MEAINSLPFEATKKTHVTVHLKKEARLRTTDVLWFEQRTKPQLLVCPPSEHISLLKVWHWLCNRAGRHGGGIGRAQGLEKEVYKWKKCSDSCF